MKTVVVTKTVDEAELAELLRPKQELTIERRTADGEFDSADGPFRHYRRSVVVDPSTEKDGRRSVTETVEFELAIPIWGFLFNPVVRKAIKSPPPPDTKVWWLPPDRMDRRATEALSRLAVFSVIAGYLGVLIGQLNPYFKIEYGASTSDISHIAIAVRVAGFSALAVVALADRRGRKTMLMISTYTAILLAVLGAFAPSLALLGASQTLTRTFSAAIALIIGIMVAEEMPAGARAFAVSMLVASAALGAGGVVVFLFLADTTQWAWRIFFVAPIFMLLPARAVGRLLPESRRFEVLELRREQLAATPEGAEDVEGVGPSSTAASPAVRRGTLERSHWFKFAVLASSALLFNTFIAPAGYFFNEFLKTEQHFNGLQISLLQVLTNLPGGLSMLVGGRLADSRGRKLIGAIGTAGGFGFTVLMYLSSGAGLWIFSTLGTFVGAIAVPALGVYSAELFPTGSRGVASGGINLFGVFGAVFGLLAAGAMAEHYGGLGPGIAILGIGPLLVVFIILFLYPETANLELEDLNPEDVAPPHDAEALATLDQVWGDSHPHGHGDRDSDGPGTPGTMRPHV